MNGIFSSTAGIQGLLQAFDRSAAAVTRATAQVDSADPADNGPDLVDGMIGMHQAEYGVRANIVAFKAADEMLGTLLDLRA